MGLGVRAARSLANPIWGRALRGPQASRLDWSAQGEHWLRDIGETSVSVEADALRRPWSAPPGTFGRHARANGRSLNALWPGVRE
jgi:hypothetical protein